MVRGVGLGNPLVEAIFSAASMPVTAKWMTGPRDGAAGTIKQQGLSLFFLWIYIGITNEDELRPEEACRIQVGDVDLGAT
jgi:hypothetical protein